MLSYFQTNELGMECQPKFSRFLHSLAKGSQDATSKTYRFIPMQDFSPESEINWDNSSAEIDQQLYNKYGLSQEEIGYIEENIKPMK